MVETELRKLISQVETRKSEEQVVEVKAAHEGCPEKLYDTVSAFANQNSGGTLLFGLDERREFARVGVYDAQDLQKKVMEYCEQMTPVVRPVFTVTEEDGLVFVSAEIPPVDIAERPCFKTAKGRLQGSYVRVGDADKRMTEYEVYSYEAFRKKYRDDVRPVEGLSVTALDRNRLEQYLLRRKLERPNLAALPVEQLYELTGVTRNGRLTLAALLLFGTYPQAYFPQLSILATAVPAPEMGMLDAKGNRFTDSKRIEGPLPEMLDGALAFVRSNTRVATRLDPTTGARIDVPQYPMDAVREAVLNALMHRDYSFHTEGMPIQLILYSDRLAVRNPGGLYGRLTVDELGYAQPDTRNPVLVTAMESLGQTENRYSGIPRIRRAMAELALPEPVFVDSRGEFSVTLYHSKATMEESGKPAPAPDERELLEFCRTPRSRAEIVAYLAIPSAQYALRRYLDPLIAAGAIRLTLPDKPRSPKQRYETAL
ncbi:MAG: putative DNA binding domain-containing protein [Oscillospiraceae bacterium]|nr:putative DNA binding domain-containing protein [Oscillospiraceae bacterium]